MPPAPENPCEWTVNWSSRAAGRAGERPSATGCRGDCGRLGGSAAGWLGRSTSTLVPSMAGAADPCLIPEHPADIDQLAELLTNDRNRNPSRYAMLLVSEGARLTPTAG